MDRFADRCALVTGAGSGIGQQITQQLLDEGARVVGADLDPAGVPEGAIALRADVSDEAEVRELVRAAGAELGRIDALFNNAGIGSTTNVLESTVDEWDRVFAVNVRGVFLCTKEVLPQMLSRGGGVIVNTASVAGMIGLRDRASYCASKGAVIALTKQIAVQWAGDGIRCNCVCPGTVDSPWVARLTASAPDPAARREELIARQPLGRLGRTDEVAAAALYLASDDAAFVTGTALVIDGGIVAA
ncbi:SDR family oxidoreductase [Kribbella pittospori]|uniref:SDR family oxidoreductase n=1 Tax=Kribbella pittospori TaxID=722689 RepID=A0A4R0KKC8_9ACTN|nr:SDR family NAD(P)-dependent oxidoreductase [Kribbella pittospori]TCC61133.1 SDR family oxidoreductase [Kribbella pittospori]